MSRRQFRVRGMSCGHCVAFVTEELEGLPGVDGVAVDLPTGVVIVTSDRELGAAEARAAVEEAGYELVE
jgi:copper chaperone